MREIGVVEAEGQLGRLLDQVEAGEEIVITRSGRAVARLLPPVPSADTAHVHDAVAGIRTMRKGARLDGLKIKDLIDEGRP